MVSTKVKVKYMKNLNALLQNRVVMVAAAIKE